MLNAIKGQLSKGLTQWALVWKWISDHTVSIFTVAVCLTLLVGWRLSRFELISPKHGLGNQLGYLGVTLMLALMIYPVRKRIKSLQVIGSVKLWFRIHMILGVIGPVFIVLHSNFHFGALNSAVALFSMLIVAVSGVVGRYIYGKIHRGLYGRRAELVELKKEFEGQKEESGPQFALIPGLKEELFVFTDDVLVHAKELVHSVKRLCACRWRAQQILWKLERLVKAYLDEHAVKHQWSPRRKHDMFMQMDRKIRFFLGQAVRTAEFNFFERLFFLWHKFHLPLAVILAVTVLIHVLAVNRY